MQSAATVTLCAASVAEDAVLGCGQYKHQRRTGTHAFCSHAHGAGFWYAAAAVPAAAVDDLVAWKEVLHSAASVYRPCQQQQQQPWRGLLVTPLFLRPRSYLHAAAAVLAAAVLVTALDLAQGVVL